MNAKATTTTLKKEATKMGRPARRLRFPANRDFTVNLILQALEKKHVPMTRVAVINRINQEVAAGRVKKVGEEASERPGRPSFRYHLTKKGEKYQEKMAAAKAV